MNEAPKTLTDAAVVCLRNEQHLLMNLLECADCQDCSPSEISIMQRQADLWHEMADVLYAMRVPNDETLSAIKVADEISARRYAEKHGHEYEQCQKCGEAKFRHPYRNCDEPE